MANYLDTHPDLKGMVSYHSDLGQMIPVVENGELLAFINRSIIHTHPVRSPLSVQDFIHGMEVLGHRFEVYRMREGEPERLLLSRAIDAEPESWQLRTNALLAAFGTGRAAEGIAFLRERDAEAEATA